MIIVSLPPGDPIERLIMLRRFRQAALKHGLPDRILAACDEAERRILRQDADRRRS